MHILTQQSLSATEEALVAEALQHPILAKYFAVLAHNIAVDIALCPIDFSEDPQTYIRKQHMLKGQLDLLETLATAHRVAQALIPE